MISLAEGVEYAGVEGLEADARRLLDHLGEARELSIHLAGDDEIRSLNATFRSKDTPTDVLSFPQEGALLGDVVISLHTAARQARTRGHALDSEVRILLVHGLCHLLGHDHHAPLQAARMRAAERELLGVLDIHREGLVEGAWGA